MAIGQQLTQIANSLERSFDFQRVVIKQQVKGFSCTTRSIFLHFFPEWLTPWFRVENRDTIEYFYDVFGKRRIEVISERCELGIIQKHANGLSLTRKDVRQLFLGLSEVYVDDVNDLFMTLKGERVPDGKLESQAAHEFAVEEGGEFEDLSIDEWDELYAKLIPFETIKSIFLNKVPSFGILSNFDGIDAMRQKRIFLCEKIRRKGPDFDLNKWNAWVTKSMLKRNEQPQGVVIPGPRGYYQVYGQLEWGGASLVLLKSMHEENPSIIKAQGTRTSVFSSKDAMLSAMDDFAKEIGLMGYKAIEQELLYLLGRRLEKPPQFDKKYQGLPPEGFRRQELRAEKFECLAFSLGSAQMQHFIQRHPDVFSDAFLMCPPGISEKKCRAYSMIRNGPFLCYAIEVDDRVHRVGLCNLGFWGDSDKLCLLVFSDVEMSRDELSALLINPPSVPESLFWTGLEFLKAFFFAHGRHTSVKAEGGNSLEEYAEFDMKSGYDDAKVVQWILSNGDWEDVRIYLRRIGLVVRENFRVREKQARARMSAMKKRVVSLVPAFLR